MKIELIERILKKNGAALAYQLLDGMNWKQLTFNDISSNIDYIKSYLTKNNIINKKILSISANCLESYILESSLAQMGSSINFANKKTLLDIQFHLDFDIIIVDAVNDIEDNYVLQNITKDKQIISIKNFKNSKELKNRCISLQSIYKIGLLSKRSPNKEDNEIKISRSEEISFLHGSKINHCRIEDLDNFIKKNSPVFLSFGKNEFSTSLYLEKDLFSKTLNLLLLQFKSKFTNNSSLDSLISHSNELMPVNLIIDKTSLKELINICYVNKVKFSELTGTKIKRVITYMLEKNDNLELLTKEKINIISLED